MAVEYDLSEFAPEKEENVIPAVTVKGKRPTAKIYDLSEFSSEANKKVDNDVLKDIPSIPGIPGLMINTAKTLGSGTDFIKKIPDALLTASKDVGGAIAAAPAAVMKGIGNIPKDIDYLKTNIPAANNLIETDPALAGKNVLAGAAELGGQVSNIPPALVDYLAHIGMISPETAKKFPRPFSNEEVTNAMDKFVGEEKPGGELLRGVTRNIPSIYGAGKAITAFNPLELTTKAISKDVMKARDAQRLIHDIEYNKIWDKAEKQGFNKVHFDPNKIDLATIKKNSTDKFYGALEKFIDDPVLKNAQKAQSDLGKLINSSPLQKSILTSEEQATRDAAISAQKYIKDRMFRNENGDVNLPLKNRYEDVTKSYERNVIPYTTNKAINEFKRGDLTKDELVKKLSKGKFRAKKGAAHPELGRRELAATLLKSAGLVGGIGGSVSGANWLINKLLNQNSGDM